MCVNEFSMVVVNSILVSIAIGFFVLLCVLIKEAFDLHIADRKGRIHGGSITSYSEYVDFTKTESLDEPKTA